jgi:hypothetical protein
MKRKGLALAIYVNEAPAMKGYRLIQVMLILFMSSQRVVAECIATPLKVLVKEAEVIAHVHRSTQQLESDRQIVRFDVLRTFKGMKYSSLDICNSDKSTERYDLNGFNAEEMVVFLRMTSWGVLLAN